jgi:hypothetical protein
VVGGSVAKAVQLSTEVSGRIYPTIFVILCVNSSVREGISIVRPMCATQILVFKTTCAGLVTGFPITESSLWD